jgi:hypothetical protein
VENVKTMRIWAIALGALGLALAAGLAAQTGTGGGDPPAPAATTAKSAAACPAPPSADVLGKESTMNLAKRIVEQNPALPPIDATATIEIETATFALG